MALEKLISSDSHVIEPPNLWLERMPKNRERAPRVVSEANGDWWYVDGHKLTSAGRSGTDLGQRFVDNRKGRLTAKFEEVAPGAYIPEARIKDNQLDGIFGEIIYPTIGIFLYRVADSTLLEEIFSAYNDWIAEFSAACSSTVKGVGLISVDDVDNGVKELLRIRERGLAGAAIPVTPAEEFPYFHPRYERFWAAAQDADVPISLHLATLRVPIKGLLYLNQAQRSTFAQQIQVSLANLIFSGVFERYPKLKVVSVEYELAWAIHFLQQMDFLYTQRTPNPEDFPPFKSDQLPSDMFRQHVYLSFQEDKGGLKARDFIGVDNLMWGSDYPHPESTFPRSRQILSDILTGVPDIERGKIAFGNAAQLYGLAA